MKDLKESNDFISNMLIKNCDHKIKCKPDFLFENFIIDTKAGYHASQKPDQLKRYFDHKKKVYVLVLKGKSRKEYIDNAIIEVINYHDFVKQSEEIIGLKIDPSTESELTQVLKQNPFWS